MYQLKFEFYKPKDTSSSYIPTVIFKPEINLTPEQRLALEQLKKDYDQFWLQEKEALMESPRITAADLSIIINSPDK